MGRLDMGPRLTKSLGTTAALIAMLVAVGVNRTILTAKAHENHDRTPDVSMPLVLSPDAGLGKQLYNADCASCHGLHLEGSAKGPSLMPYDRVHHPDGDFVKAMKSGVKQHHWNFGDMPAHDKLTDQEIQRIIVYVREIQAFNAEPEEER